MSFNGNKEVEFFSQYDVSLDGFNLWCRVQPPTFGERTAYFLGAPPIIERKVGERYDGPVEPFIAAADTFVTAPPILNWRTFLQAAMDYAWALGMRPAGFEDRATEPQLAAIRYHPEDMRKLALKP